MCRLVGLVLILTFVTGSASCSSEPGTPQATPSFPSPFCENASAPRYRGAELRDKTFQSKKFNCGDFSDSRLERVTFVDSRLGGASFQGAQLRDVTFKDTSLTGVDFRGARLDKVRLIRSSVRAAVFEPGAELSDITFDNAVCPDGAYTSEVGDCYRNGMPSPVG